jgi:hypothetical protein
MIRNGTTLPGRSPAHQEVVGALDQACAIWGLAGGDGRSRFIQHCLRYGLLSLLDAGVRDISEAAEPEFVRHYREMEARLSAAGAGEPARTKVQTKCKASLRVPSRTERWQTLA